jgi:hypothetical protein
MNSGELGYPVVVKLHNNKEIIYKIDKKYTGFNSILRKVRILLLGISFNGTVQQDDKSSGVLTFLYKLWKRMTLKFPKY